MTRGEPSAERARSQEADFSWTAREIVRKSGHGLAPNVFCADEESHRNPGLNATEPRTTGAAIR